MFVFYLYIIIDTKIFCEFSIVLLSSNNVSCTNSYFSFTNRLSLVFYSFLWVNAAVHCLITGSLNIKRLIWVFFLERFLSSPFVWRLLRNVFMEKKWVQFFWGNFELFKKMLVRPLAIVEKLLKTLFYFLVF